ncbi:MAG: hypothetical protein HY094_02295 [Candidatus Melainabacteria bacterium]|nr:hypothetical protein [Candidatus Melainabacteria bacterium]
MGNVLFGVKNAGVASTPRSTLQRNELNPVKRKDAIQNIKLDLNKSPYKYLAYTGLIGGIASTVWKLISGKENSFKNWILPVLSFGASGFFALLNIKDKDIINKKTIDLKNESGRKEVFNEIVSGLIKSWSNSFEVQKDEVSSLLDIVRLIENPITNMDYEKLEKAGLYLDFDKNFNAYYVQTYPSQNVTMGNTAYALRIYFDGLGEQFDSDTKVTVDFLSKNVNLDGDYKVEERSELSLREIVLNGWIKNIPGGIFTDAQKKDLLDYKSAKSDSLDEQMPDILKLSSYRAIRGNKPNDFPEDDRNKRVKRI